jgi:O-antigen ligase
VHNSLRPPTPPGGLAVLVVIEIDIDAALPRVHPPLLPNRPHRTCGRRFVRPWYRAARTKARIPHSPWPLYHSRVGRKQSKPQPTPPAASRWHVAAFAALFLLVQLAVLPGSLSAFRTPKSALAVLGITAIVALAMIGRIRRNHLQVPRGHLAAVLTALPALQALSALWSHSPRAALAAAVTSGVWVAGILWLATLESDDRDQILRWCAAGAAISAAILLLQAAGVRVIEFTESVRGRFELTGLAGNPADLSMSAVLLLPLLLHRTSEDSRRWWEWGLLSVLAAAAAVSQTLTAWAALGLLLLVWFAQARSWRLWLGTSVVMVVVLAGALATGLDRRLESKWEQLASGNLYRLLSARTDGWTAAAEMARTRPLTGVGAGNYTIEFYPSRLDWLVSRGTSGQRGEFQTHFEWAHCDPLQHVAELGLAGLAWLLALCWALVRLWPRSPNLVALGLAATGPFLLLHYPGHLALGLMPIALMSAHLVALDDCATLSVSSRSLRTIAAIGLLIAVVIVGMWQMRQLALDLWHGDLERRLAAAQATSDGAERVREASSVELEVMRRIDRLPGAQPWLWRVVGMARLLRENPKSAEPAFRRAHILWPHEEAEFGLGLALAAQGRRNEALVHLGNVCRVNRSLVRRIADKNLRGAVLDLMDARSQQVRGDHVR